jgi:hypothetical protein
MHRALHSGHTMQLHHDHWVLFVDGGLVNPEQPLVLPPHVHLHTNDGTHLPQSHVFPIIYDHDTKTVVHSNSSDNLSANTASVASLSVSIPPPPTRTVSTSSMQSASSNNSMGRLSKPFKFQLIGSSTTNSSVSPRSNISMTPTPVLSSGDLAVGAGVDIDGTPRSPQRSVDGGDYMLMEEDNNIKFSAKKTPRRESDNIKDFLFSPLSPPLRASRIKPARTPLQSATPTIAASKSINISNVSKVLFDVAEADGDRDTENNGDSKTALMSTPAARRGRKSVNIIVQTPVATPSTRSRAHQLTQSRSLRSSTKRKQEEGSEDDEDVVNDDFVYSTVKKRVSVVTATKTRQSAKKQKKQEEDDASVEEVAAPSTVKRSRRKSIRF